MQRGQKNVRRQRGIASVEFALTIVFVLFAIFWIFELMMFIYSYSVMATAAKEGVRYAVVHGCGNDSTVCSAICTPACADATGANIQTEVRNYARLAFHGVTDTNPVINVNFITSPGAPPGGALDTVRVVVQYTYNPYFSFGWTPSINAAAEGHVSN